MASKCSSNPLLQAVQLGQAIAPERQAAMLKAFVGDDVQPDEAIKAGGRCMLDDAVRQAAFMSPTTIYYQQALDVVVVEFRAHASALKAVPFRR